MKTPPLANAELAVMELLWQETNLTAQTIKERLYPGAKKSQHGTVQRLLQRLEEKSFVERDRSLSVHLFSPAITREAYASSQVESLTRRLTGGSLVPLVTHLMAERRITPTEIKRLRRLLDELDGEGENE